MFAMEIEAAFGIRIPEAEGEKISTARELHAYVCRQMRSKLPEKADLPCLTSTAFYRLRRLIQEETKIPARSLTPQSPVERLLPPIMARRERRDTWRRLQYDCGLYLPHLEHSKYTSSVLRVFVWSGVLAILTINVAFGFGLLGWAGCLLGWLLILAAVTNLAQPLAVYLPAGSDTFGDLARRYATRQYIRLAEARSGWNEGEIWRVLQHILGEDAEVSPDSVQPDFRLALDFDDY